MEAERFVMWPASFYCRSDKAVILARAAGPKIKKFYDVF